MMKKSTLVLLPLLVLLAMVVADAMPQQQRQTVTQTRTSDNGFPNRQGNTETTQTRTTNFDNRRQQYPQGQTRTQTRTTSYDNGRQQYPQSTTQTRTTYNDGYSGRRYDDHWIPCGPDLPVAEYINSSNKRLVEMQHMCLVSKSAGWNGFHRHVMLIRPRWLYESPPTDNASL